VSVRFGFNAVPTHHNHSLATGLIFRGQLKGEGQRGFVAWYHVFHI